ncbi:TonB-dependent receptor [Chitinophaga horti]|uniref:TonB-dependent receptor n=1 Tax=Chitinophaga horti TaxID=2920382 RepID=A0ABY6J8F7_9BACT|nr:TonB-dependent receptor [Chitinophaga horti]UYQ94592.1 TonB-dependent receptor [Chitinophaga horti]
MRYFIPTLLLCGLTQLLHAQQADTTRLSEVVVTAYPGNQSLVSLPASAAVLSQRQLQLQPGVTLVPALNTVPGIRMEERSPGSYRLSIRGSLLRSPFGIRNVKIYMDEMPLTDAGGNSYLNLADPGGIGSIEVLKGPDGSLFGANSGGVVLLRPFASEDTGSVTLGLQGGSYGAFQERAGWNAQWGKVTSRIYQAWQQSDGYRDNSRMRRLYLQSLQQWRYNERNSLKLLAFYSDLGYRTPGGLNAAQAAADPRAARPATPTLPGAETQKAGIYNRTFQAGLVHEAAFTPFLKHVVSVSGATTHFENPFITNYEARDENSGAVRTYLSLHDKNIGSTYYDWNVGLEWQQTGTDIINYGNRAGKRDTVQAADKITARQQFYFTRFTFRFPFKLTLEAAASLNYFRYHFSNDSTATQTRRFSPQLMPRVALSYRLTPFTALRASVSRGYSPPATAEVRASDNVINTALQAENGWNYELGFRASDAAGLFWLDASVFQYRLEDAIVRRLRDDGTEFFANAGGTKQNGLEIQGHAWLLRPSAHRWIRGIQLSEAWTFSDFSFRDYKSGADDFSGKQLTGVPRHVLVSGLLLQFPADVYLFAQHNYTEKLPLNDANTAFADSYHLLQAKAGWRFRNITIYAGADNLLNEYYSLGNDLNALGQRYFNPAPERNYYAGVSFRW